MAKQENVSNKKIPFFFSWHFNYDSNIYYTQYKLGVGGNWDDLKMNSQMILNIYSMMFWKCLKVSVTEIYNKMF